MTDKAFESSEEEFKVEPDPEFQPLYDALLVDYPKRGPIPAECLHSRIDPLVRAIALTNDRVVREAQIAQVGERKWLGIKALKGEVAKLRLEILAKLNSNVPDEAGRQSGSPYCVQDGQITSGNRVLAGFSARITDEVILDDGQSTTRELVIIGQVGEEVLPEVRIPAEEFSELKWVTTHWGSRCWTQAKMGQYVVEAIKRASRDTVIESHSYVHFGWRVVNDQRTFLLPKGGMTSNGVVPVEVRTPEKLARYFIGEPPANAKESSQSIVTLIELLRVAPYKVSAPLLLSMFLAPLTSTLGPTIFVWLHGPSGSLKSSLVALYLCLYGDFDYRTLVESWFSTQNAIEITLWRAKDVPVPIDNLVPAQTGRGLQELLDKAVRVVQTYGDGSSRGRLDSHSNEKDPRPPRCLPIATAEQPPPGNASTLGRLLCIPAININQELLFPLANSTEKKAIIHQLGMGYLKYLASVDPSEIKALHLEARQGVLDDFRESLTPETHLRVIETLALLRTAQGMLYAYIRSTIPAGQAKKVIDALHPLFQGGLKEALREQITMQANEGSDELNELVKGSSRQIPVVESFLGCLRTMIQAGEVGLATGANGRFTQPESLEVGERWIPKVGWLVDDEVWLHPTAAEQAVRRKLGSDCLWKHNHLVHELRTILLQCSEERPSTKKSTSTSRNERVWILPRDVVLGASPEEVGGANYP